MKSKINLLKALISNNFKISSPPEKVTLELTSKCNLKCSFCFRTNKFPTYDLPKYEALRIVNELGGVKEICVFGVGEPLTYPIEDLVEIINAVERKSRSTMVTNGVLLTKKISDKLSKSNLPLLRVSIDSPDPKIYKKIRGVDIEIVKKNIAYFTSISKIPVWVQAIITKGNEKSLIDMPDLCKEIGATKLCLGNLIAFENIKESQFKTDIKADILKIKELCKERGIDFSPPNKKRNKRWCLQPFSNLYINSQGFVSSCCCMPPQNLFKFTNLIESWNCDGLIALRKNIVNGFYPEWCQKSCEKVNKK